MKPIVKALLVCIAGVIISGNAYAGEKVHVVFKDPYYRDFALEIAPMFGMQMNSTYVSTIGPALTVSAIFNNLAAVELSGIYFISGTTSFYDYLGQGEESYLPGSEIGGTGQSFSVTPQDGDVTLPKWTGTLAIRLTPIYGKFTIMNDILANVDLFLLGGIGLINTEIPSTIVNYLESKQADWATRVVDDFEPTKMTGLLGGGMRFFLARWFTVRVEVRDYVFAEQGRDKLAIAMENQYGDLRDSKLRQLIMVMGGVSFLVP